MDHDLVPPTDRRILLDSDLTFGQVIDAVDRHAEAVWAGLIVAGLGWDIWLLRNGRRTLSQAARCPAGWALMALIVAHFVDLLGPLDPFHAAARLIARSTP